ncbi:GtrA family protein [Pelotalea chapellei]|uniref:GtrA family protein n=1 Tax=Pelotalea chapellei TaxID=44671 RepID=A0ABS5U968_9BACT|nr:GtrA family protein [Pelotalea chapellei]MBT1072181.1 GtrA family protein [Pelotalea chapellei]
MKKCKTEKVIGQTTRLSEIVRQLIRFNLVGVLNTLIDFSLFFALNAMGVAYLLAQIFSYGCGIINSYFFNKYWTFRTAEITAAEVARFITINLSALAISVLLVYLFHSQLHVPLLPAKVVATVFTMLISFCGTRLWVFKVETSPIE